jgi:hypothetical protein
MSFDKNNRQNTCQEHRRSIEDMRRLLYGDPTTGKGGIAHLVEDMGEAIYGGDRVEKGLIEEVSDIRRLIFISTGFIIGAQVAVQAILFILKQ